MSDPGPPLRQPPNRWSGFALRLLVQGLAISVALVLAVLAAAATVYAAIFISSLLRRPS
jgi:hypothetical protein